MKKLLLILICLFFDTSSLSSDDWIFYGKSIDGNEFYYKNLKRHNDFIYVERMTDLLKPDEDGTMCYWDYRQINCSNYFWKLLNFQVYTRPKCSGKGKHTKEKVKNHMKIQDWRSNKFGELDYNFSKKLCTDQIMK